MSLIDNRAFSFYAYKIMDYRQTYQLVFEYIETFYNTVRIHNHCGYMSPNNYESEFFKCRS